MNRLWLHRSKLRLLRVNEKKPGNITLDVSEPALFELELEQYYLLGSSISLSKFKLEKQRIRIGQANLTTSSQSAACLPSM